MKEKPILFSAPMVRAILGGTKTQTRRVVKPQPRMISAPGPNVRFLKPFLWWKDDALDNDYEVNLRSPYGQPGDRLWVRETWGTSAGWNAVKPSELPSDVTTGFAAPIRYGADGAENDGRWRPSIFMLRWMSRITLEVVSVRVERLNDITEADAVAEGVEMAPAPKKSYKNYLAMENTDALRWFHHPTLSYISLWESLNGAGSWEKNPWVWVVEFKRVATQPGQ